MAPPRRPSVTAGGVDPGLQPERTAMAWSRTWLALVTISAVFLRWVPHYGAGMMVLPILTLTVAGVILATQRRRLRRGVQSLHDHVLAADPVAPLGIVGVLLTLGVAGVTFVLAAP